MLDPHTITLAGKVFDRSAGPQGAWALLDALPRFHSWEIDTMGKKMFAVKVESHQKAIMDLISRDTKMKLSRLYMPAITMNTSHWMGVIAHYNLELVKGQDISVYEEAFALPRARSTFVRGGGPERGVSTIPGIYLWLDEQWKIRNGFRFFTEIFDGLEFDRDVPVLVELDYWMIAGTVGSGYMESASDVSTFDRELALSLILSVFLDNYFWRTAIGTYHTLHTQWYAQRNYVANLKRELGVKYFTESESPLEAIQLVEPL